MHAAIARDIYVEGDNSRLVQCVSSILTNAVKYTDEDGTLNFTLALEADRAVMTISDNGIGIQADLLPRIFELFVQDDRSLDRSQGGLGIGLSVVRRLIEMQYGTVSASSPDAGQGSTFRISLPVITAPLRDIPQQPEPAGAPLRILVVDDNRDAADSLAMLLSIEGHTVRSEYDGLAALNAGLAFNADLILLDIGLPSQDGLEVARRLRAAGNRSRLVALTGYGQKDDIERASKAGFDAHLTKPVDFSKVEALLLAITRRR